MKQLKCSDFKNAFCTISKHEQKIYNDLLTELTRSVKKLSKSWNIKNDNWTDNQRIAEYNRTGRFAQAYKNLIQFEIDHFSEENKKRYKKENRVINLWDALTIYPWRDNQKFFSDELFWLWDDYQHHFENISGMIAKGYININRINYIKNLTELVNI